MPTDPVCQMDVDEESAAAHNIHQGKAYGLGAPGYQEAFEKDPERCVSKRTDLQDQEIPSDR